jgi:hypothetical protein
MFKSITGPPSKNEDDRRGCIDFLSDIGLGMGYTVSHVEIVFPDNTAFLASADRGVRERPRSIYNNFDPEGNWTTFELYLPYTEVHAIRSFCVSQSGSMYDLKGLICGLIPCCNIIFKQTRSRYTCTSLCLEALMQSPTFRRSLETSHIVQDLCEYGRHPQKLYDLLVLISTNESTRTMINIIPVQTLIDFEGRSREDTISTVLDNSYSSSRDSDTSESDDT